MATRKLASTRQILNGDYDREIYEAMARAMFVSDWADRQEEKGKTYPGMDLMDVAPPTSRDALLAARALAAAVIKDNNVKSLTDLYARALNAGGEGDARKFGHYLAMQAMGHGVSWYDDGNPEFGLKLPHFEYYSGRGRAAQKLGHAAGDSTEQLRVRIAEALKWTVKETESFSFPQLASFVRGKDAQLDADLARHIESASHWFKPARRSRRKGLASGRKSSGVRAAASSLTHEQKTLAPYVRAFDNGSSFTATVSEAGIDAFTRSWPASGIRDLRGVSFMFDKKNGDLEDIRYKNGTPEDWDGPALVALSEDAQAVARTRLKIAGLASGRSGRKGLVAASGSKAKAKGGHMLRIYDKKDATRLVRETHHTSRARALKSRDDFERRHGRHPHAIDAADAKGLASGSKAKAKAKRTRVKASCACSATAVTRKKRSHS